MNAKKDKRKDKGREHAVAEVPVERLRELEEKAQACEDFRNKWLSVHADYENTCRRLEKERTDYVKFANEDLVLRLFPIMDNFDMALDAMGRSEDKEAVLEGIKMVQKEFHRVLEESGVKKIDAVGEKFDPEVHEAFSAETTDEHPDNTVIKEVRAGYKLKDRLIRPAQVIVAQNSEEGDTPDQDPERAETEEE